MDRAKRIWYLSQMQAAKVQASLRIRAVSPEPSLLAHTSSESRGTFRQKIRSLVPLNGWACAVEICNDGMFEDTNSLNGAHILSLLTPKCTLPSLQVGRITFLCIWRPFNFIHFIYLKKKIPVSKQFKPYQWSGSTLFANKRNILIWFDNDFCNFVRHERIIFCCFVFLDRVKNKTSIQMSRSMTKFTKWHVRPAKA